MCPLFGRPSPGAVRQNITAAVHAVSLRTSLVPAGRYAECALIVRYVTWQIQDVNFPCAIDRCSSRTAIRMRRNCTPLNCALQDLGICLASENGCTAEGLNLHGAEGTGATGRRHRR